MMAYILTKVKVNIATYGKIDIRRNEPNQLKIKWIVHTIDKLEQFQEPLELRHLMHCNLTQYYKVSNNFTSLNPSDYTSLFINPLYSLYVINYFIAIV